MVAVHVPKVAVIVAVVPDGIPETVFPLTVPADEVITAPAGAVTVAENVKPSAAHVAGPLIVIVGTALTVTMASPGVVLSHPAKSLSTQTTVYVVVAVGATVMLAVVWPPDQR